LGQRTGKEVFSHYGNETVTNCHGLKMIAADNIMRMTNIIYKDYILFKKYYSSQKVNISEINVSLHESSFN